MFVSETQKVEIRPELLRQLRKVEERYAEQQRRKSQPEFSLNRLRVSELKRLLTHRYRGRPLPDDDAGRDDARIMLNHIARYDECVRWAEVNAPWMALHEIALYCRAPVFLKAAEVGDRCGVTRAERSSLRFRTIRAAGETDALMKERVGKENRDSKRAKRKAKRATKPPTQAESKPWLVEGISESTWRRRRRKERTLAGLDPHKVGRPKVQESGIADDSKSVRNKGTITRDGFTVTTKPAVAGTHSPDRLSKVDGVAGVGNPSRKLKTRFPTAMRLNREQRAYALDAGFTPDQVGRMLEMMRDHALANRTYSADWGQVWFSHVDREIDFHSQRSERACRARGGHCGAWRHV